MCGDRHQAGQQRSRSAGARAREPAGQGFRDAQGVGSLGGAPGEGLQGQRAAAIAPGRIEGDALRIESEMKRLGVDAPGEWLAMAQDARRRNVPEPEPSALGHRALKAKARRRDHRGRPEVGDRGDQGVLSGRRRPIRRRLASTWPSGKVLTPTIRAATYRDGSAHGAQGARSPALGRRHGSPARRCRPHRTCRRPSPSRSRRRARSRKSRPCRPICSRRRPASPARTWEACG